MRALAIDPGSTRSALVGLESRDVVTIRETSPGHLLHNTELNPPIVVERMLAPNEDVLEAIAKLAHAFDVLAIEWIESYGMPVGREVFETCRWVGHYEREWLRMWPARQRPANRSLRLEPRLVTRRAVKLALCGSARAKDANVRAALLELYGGKAAAIGRKAAPGPLFGLRADQWSALAVGVVAMGAER